MPEGFDKNISGAKCACIFQCRFVSAPVGFPVPMISVSIVIRSYKIYWSCLLYLSGFVIISLYIVNYLFFKLYQWFYWFRSQNCSEHGYVKGIVFSLSNMYLLLLLSFLCCAIYFTILLGKFWFAILCTWQDHVSCSKSLIIVSCDKYLCFICYWFIHFCVTFYCNCTFAIFCNYNLRFRDNNLFLFLGVKFSTVAGDNLDSTYL